ncbi:erythrocyte membrane protein 1, PfEMP1, putative [Plasmodium reichenowi]|uniref:Erythrocyte membrane protein 1, PfEMP1, putative n=1 Tax=Plasmodium reichenowi TaxID=5854 RepID=A0A2P9D9P8_PLARE|nr:erythrocyte membrane protein 1, PfEMP1, putative [Plasmodium reichenowi]
MAPQAEARTRGGGRGMGEDDIDEKDAKHLLDSIGKIVHDEVKNDAERYKEALKGSLSQVSTNSETAGFSDPCRFEYNEHTSSAKDNTKPCGKDGNVERFSDTQGAQCDYRKISNSKNYYGACAPYRRLHLCNKNMEKMGTNNNDGKARNDLLAEVCYAAKYEGESLKTHHPQHQANNADSKICTVLSRSFADIGDIVRGKDLYRGGRGRKKLDEKLKDIFSKIHSEVTSSGNNKDALKTRYSDDTTNYFKLREDWWIANRHTVWKALTCEAPDDSKYFRQTCNYEGTLSDANHKCRCKDKKGENETDEVPTYFDYVPQYLRWFHEWAEDFCRKRKKKLEDAIKICRGDSGRDKYCDLNRHDCVQTIRGDERFVENDDCKDCQYSCSHFVKWIDKQKVEFDKQKRKYTSEISDGDSGRSRSRKRRSALSSSDDNGYEKKFYEKFKGKCGTVNVFLGLLSKEKTCKDQPEVGNETADAADFTNEKYLNTFSHTQYCQACPWCGAQKDNNEKWEAKDDKGCGKAKEYLKYRNTPIPIITGDKSKSRIQDKYKKFCNANGKKNTTAVPTGEKGAHGAPDTDASGDSNSDNATTGYCADTNNRDKDPSLCEKWTCYYKKKENKEGSDGSDDINFCVLEDGKEKTEDRKDKSYNVFFWDWVHDMLHDSVDWRKELRSCINKDNGNTCRNPNKCNNDCGCFAKWVKQKQTEWGNIKKHFLMQEDMILETGCNPFVTLEYLFKEGDLLQNIKDTHADAKEDEIKNIQEMLKQAGVADGVVGGPGTSDCDVTDGTQNTSIIDKFLQEELNEANRCKTCTPPEDKDLSRSLKPLAPRTNGDESENSEDEFEEEREDEDEEPAQDEAVDVDSTVTDTTTVDNICKIVGDALGDKKNLQEACDLKYNKGKNYGWRCVTPTTTKDNEGIDGKGDGSDSSHPSRQRREAVRSTATPGKSGDSSNSGTICVPPRRRKLYIGKIYDWATKQNAGTTQVEGVLQEGQEAGARATQATAGEAPSQPNSHPPQAGTSSPLSSDNGLLAAFVESAAIETFFLWHQYKQLHKPQGDGTSSAKGNYAGYSGSGVDVPFGGSIVGMSAGSSHTSLGKGPPGLSGPTGRLGISGLQQPVPRPPGLGGDSSQNGLMDHTVGQVGKAPGSFTSDSDSSSPETTLASGTIPPEFLRQMFYTIADYRDILMGNTDIVVKALSDEDQKAMKEIEEKIKTLFPTSDSSQPPRGILHPNSVKDPKTLWNDTLGPVVWRGMVCALTYEDKSDGPKGVATTLKQDSDLKTKLYDNNTKENGKYNYKKVTLEDEEDIGTQAMTGSSRTPPSNGTTLAEFVTCPAYFRWLEEWGTEFCVKRKEMLGKIKEECTKDGDGKTKKCSGYGEACDYIRTQNYDTVPSFNCPDCGKECRKYRKWINTKKTEYEEQQNAYNGQKTKCQTESTGSQSNPDETSDKKFCGTVQNLSDAAAFLNRLKNGPCKKNNEGAEHKTGNDYINFGEKDKTFGHETYCDPCSLVGAKCNNGNCRSASKGNTCNGETITTEKLKDKTDCKDVVMIVSDNSETTFTDELKDACEHAGIFKGIRKEQWTCGKVCGVDICEPKNVKEGTNGKEYIQIRALLKHWVDNFLEDYNKIKHKISHCIKNGETQCISGCDKKCNCVEKWISTKKEEWPTIRDRYLQQYKNEYGHDYNVKTFLQDPQFHNEVQKAIGPCKDLDLFQDSRHCAVDPTSQKGGKEGKKSDIIDCLLQKLGEKAKKCPNQTTDTECTIPPSTHVGDEEEENPENTVGKQHPSFCDEVLKNAETEDQTNGGCDPVNPSGEEGSGSVDGPSKPEAPDQDSGKESTSSSGDSTPEQTPQPPASGGEEKAKPPEIPNPPQVEKNPFEHPYVKPALVTSTLAWSVGIAFFALSYWWLKKKTRRPVELFSVLEIPKNDYNIPTFKSSNRYIPYSSSKYRGKRYIYLEGDTDEDKYIGDITSSDITSSSESEYEEFDINDIYVPHAPKYKTLIEVVLEPSGKNTPTSDTPNNKLTEEEWNQLKQNFISNMLQNTQPNDLPNDYTSGKSPANTNNTTTSRDTLDQKPFIMSIHDRNLYTGEEYSYDMINNIGNNDLYSGENDLYNGIDPTSDNHNLLSDNRGPYSGIDLINDALNCDYDIYDEILKRKENELFGTEHHPKRTNTYSVAKPARDDPLHNQLNFFHKWLDRHRNMCEKWDKNNKVEMLDKFKEEWENETPTIGNKQSDIPSGKLSGTPSDNNIHSDIHPSDIPNGKLSDTPSGNNKPSDVPDVLNTDVSIQIDMNNPKPTNIVDINPDTYFDKYTAENINPVDENPTPNNPNHVQIEMSVKNTQMAEEKYPIGDVWDI